MITSDLHIHTNWCDGKDSPEDMVLAAIDRGFVKVGILAHAYTEFDDSYCLPRDNYNDFKEEVRRLKEKYAGKIEVLCGIEQDIFSTMSTEGFDYIIGSAHYVLKNGIYYPIDSCEDGFKELIEAYDGDVYAMCEDYYKQERNIVAMTGADIIGHFNLVVKYNELPSDTVADSSEDNRADDRADNDSKQDPDAEAMGMSGKYIDENDPRYISAWTGAVDELIKYGRPFEINTGAISRGYRKTPYPDRNMVNAILSRGGVLLPGSDSHSKEAVGCQLDKWAEEFLH